MSTTATAPSSLATRDAMVEEGRRIVDAARERGVVLRLFGGLAVRASCRAVDFCARDYGDFDMIGRHAQRKEIARLMRELGFTENFHFSQATRGRQLQFVRPCRHTDDGAGEGRRAHDDDHVDIFLDIFRMDHELRLGDRLEIDDYTIPVSDQLLTKLQVHKQDAKDVRDVLTLLKDVDLNEAEAPGVIGLGYIAGKCAADWGLQHDVERNLDRVEALAPTYALSDEEEGRVREGLARLREALADAPKSVTWRLRAKVGERRPWYQLVEEQGEET